MHHLQSLLFLKSLHQFLSFSFARLLLKLRALELFAKLPYQFQVSPEPLQHNASLKNKRTSLPFPNLDLTCIYLTLLLSSVLLDYLTLSNLSYSSPNLVFSHDPHCPPFSLVLQVYFGISFRLLVFFCRHLTQRFSSNPILIFCFFKSHLHCLYKFKQTLRTLECFLVSNILVIDSPCFALLCQPTR